MANVNLSAAVKKGRLPGLEALRDHLARQLEDAEPRECAAIARQLASVLAQLEAMAPPKKSRADELAKRRAARRAAAKVSGDAGSDRVVSGQGGD
jgi:hypothetical protein